MQPSPRDFGNHHERSITPSTASTFSLTSTMENRVFRDDAGRRYQATNDEYSTRVEITQLPADEPELERLDLQHKGFKAMQGDKNYLAPLDQALKADGTEGKRLLDVGTGTGIWAIEVAKEFPHVDVTGIDLSPVQHQHQVPDNCHFALEDATHGLPYPDGYFDVVHVRALLAGIRHWPALIDEAIRVAKSGGLVVFVEIASPPRLTDTDNIESAPGLAMFAKYFKQGLETRGMHPYAGSCEIPEHMRSHSGVRNVRNIAMPVPMSPWSEDPMKRTVGELMIIDSKVAAEAFRLMVVDACGITSTEYDHVKAGFFRDLDDPKVQDVIPMAHVWGWKK